MVYYTHQQENRNSKREAVEDPTDHVNPTKRPPKKHQLNKEHDGEIPSEQANQPEIKFGLIIGDMGMYAEQGTTPQFPLQQLRHIECTGSRSELRQRTNRASRSPLSP
jgi:hypothetical protein